MSSSAHRHRRPSVTILSAYDRQVLADGPIMYLLLSGGSAGAADRTGNGYTAVAYNGPTITTFPNGDNATAFDGATQYLEVASNENLSVATTGILTLEAWMRPDTLQFPNSEGSGYVYWMGKNTSGESEYSTRMYSLVNSEDRPNRISGYAFNLVGGLGAGSYFQDTITVGEWIHYAFVINAINTSSPYPTGYTTIYKNGVLRQTRSLISYDIVPQDGTAPFRIATAEFGSFFQGAIAKVAIYNYELSPFRIRDHYELVVPASAGTSAWIKNVGTASSAAAGTVLTITVPSEGVSAGDTLIVRVAHTYTAGGPTVIDSRGNTYTRDQTSPNTGQTMRASLFRGQMDNPLQAGDTIELTTAASTAVRLMSVDEFSGIIFNANGTGLDQKDSTSGDSTDPGTTIPITTTNANDLLVGMVAVGGPNAETYTEDPNLWTTMARVGTDAGSGDITLNSAYQVTGLTAKYNYQPILGTTEDWIEIIASYIAGVPTVTPTPQGTVLFIQNIGAFSSKAVGSSMTIAVPYGGVPVGHTLIVRVLHDYTTGGPTVSDARGNTYNRDRTAADTGTTIRASIFSATVTTALQAGDLITISLSASVSVGVAVADEFANVAGPIVIDAQNGLSGTGAAPALSNPTSNANDLLIGMVAVAGDVADTYTEDTIHEWDSLTRIGTTGGTFNTNRTINTAFRVVGATGTYSYAPTLGTSSVWVEFSMAYEAGPDNVTPPPSGTAVLIQNVGNASSKLAGTTLSVTVPSSGVPVGHTLIVRVLHDYTAGAPTISDSRGNIYNRDRTAADISTTIRASQYSCPVSTALLSGDTITITLSASVNVRAATIDEFSHVLQPIVVDAQNGLSNTSTTPALPLTTTDADDLLIGMVAVAGDVDDTYDEDTYNLWTSLTRVGTTGGTFDTNRTINSAYRSVGVANTYHYDPTLETSSLWIEFLIAYEAH